MPDVRSDRTRPAAPRRATTRISRCTRADLAEILAGLQLFWGDADSQRLETLRHLHHPMFVHELGDASLAVRERGRVVAYLLGFVVPTKRLAYVHLVAVRRDRQRDGLATRLYVRFMEQARRQGCVRIKAITAPSNRESIAFHARLGMKPVGEVLRGGVRFVPDYSGPGAHRVVMVGALQPPARARRTCRPCEPARGSRGAR